MSKEGLKGSAARNGRRSKSKPRSGAPDAAPDPVAAEIDSLTGMGVDALRAAWRRRFRSQPPPIQSADFLRRLFAWKIQVEAYGDLDTETLALLKRARAAVAKGQDPVAQRQAALRPGTILTREWRGVTHRVVVQDPGFEHDGKQYRSLSEIARAISGTRWSGPRFFGIEQKEARDLLFQSGHGERVADRNSARKKLRLDVRG